MAAGMGSRYGGLKQLDTVGPSGETIFDYSVYDAIEAGFNKVVFIIRKDFEQEFKSMVTEKYIGKINHIRSLILLTFSSFFPPLLRGNVSQVLFAIF